MHVILGFFFSENITLQAPVSICRFSKLISQFLKAIILIEFEKDQSIFPLVITSSKLTTFLEVVWLKLLFEQDWSWSVLGKWDLLT